MASLSLLIMPLMTLFSYAATPKLHFIPAPGIGWAHADIQIRERYLGIYDRPPRPRRAGEKRVLLVSDSWFSGLKLPLEDTIPKQLGKYLTEYSGHPVTVINGAVPDSSPLDSLFRLEALLSTYHFDTVLFLIRGGGQLVRLAALDTYLDHAPDGHVTDAHYFTEDSLAFRALAPLVSDDPNRKQLLLRHLNIQYGMIKLGYRLSGPRDADKILEPFLQFMKDYQTVSEAHGAKFAMIWSKLMIRQSTWTMSTPTDLGYWLLAALDPFKQRHAVSAEKLFTALRSKDEPFPIVVNHQLNSLLATLEDDPQARHINSRLNARLTDQIGKILATTLIASGLEI